MFFCYVSQQNHSFYLINQNFHVWEKILLYTQLTGTFGTPLKFGGPISMCPRNCLSQFHWVQNITFLFLTLTTEKKETWYWILQTCLQKSVKLKWRQWTLWLQGGGSEIIQRFVLPLEKRCQHPAVVKLCTVKPFVFVEWFQLYRTISPCTAYLIQQTQNLLHFEAVLPRQPETPLLTSNLQWPLFCGHVITMIKGIITTNITVRITV